MSRRGREWLVIARREFHVRVRSKWFAIVTVLGPIGMLGLILVPAYVGAKSATRDVYVEVLDRTEGGLGERVLESTRQINEHLKVRVVPSDERELSARIASRTIDGYLVLPSDLMVGGAARYTGANVTNQAFRALLQYGLNRGVQRERWRLSGQPDDQFDAFAAQVELVATQDTGTGTETSGEAAFFLGYAVMLVLYMAIVIYAVNVMRSVIEEKSSRVVEIMISTIKPMPLMMGKILGVGAVGIFQLGIWIGMAIVIYQGQSTILEWFGISGAQARSLPPVGADAVAVILSFFLFGFFFYAALYASVGAMVNTEQEAQQVQMPVILLLVIPVACMQVISDDPRGVTAKLFTVVPFSSPVLMPMRYLLGGASLREVATSLAVLFMSLSVVVWVAARIYRVGILMYGKRPSFREVFRWVKHS